MLDSAEFLVRQSGATDFSMLALATAAEVSPSTPYNFFVSKEGLLFALLTRHLSTIMEEALVYNTDDPLEQVIEAAENVVNIILRDSIFLRPLYKVLLGMTDPVHHPQFLKNAFVFYRLTLKSAVEQGLLTDEYDCRMLASSLMAHFMGLLDLWVHEDIDDGWFRAQVVYGFILHLWPFAHDKHLKMLEKKLARTKKILTNPKLHPAFVS